MRVGGGYSVKVRGRGEELAERRDASRELDVEGDGVLDPINPTGRDESLDRVFVSTSAICGRCGTRAYMDIDRGQ